MDTQLSNPCNYDSMLSIFILFGAPLTNNLSDTQGKLNKTVVSLV